jgi:tetratricopeptide (TPR) repeat protein
MRRPGRPSRVATVAALSLALVLAAPLARAADPQAPETTEQLAERAYQLQAAGKYADAVATYLKAYELSKDALTLLNVARIYDQKLHENELASEYYRRYVMAPDAEPDRVKRVTERITALKREAEEERAKAVAAPSSGAANAASPPPADAVPPPASSAPTEASPGAGMRTAGVVVGVVGLLGVGTSFALGAAAKSKNNDANAACSGSVCQTQAGVDAAHSAGSFATGSTIAFAAGLAFVAGGIVLYIAAPSHSSGASSSAFFLAPRVDPTGAGLALHGAF